MYYFGTVWFTVNVQILKLTYCNYNNYYATYKSKSPVGKMVDVGIGKYL